MLPWLRLVLLNRCCGVWSPWVQKEAEYTCYPRDFQEKALLGEEFVIFETWQERRCLRCGRMQQRRLEF